MSLFKLRKSGGPRDLEVSMAGLKLGSNVLQVDGPDAGLIAALAKAVGLSGRACAVASTEEAEKAFAQEETRQLMSGYHELVKTGRREIYKLA